MATVNPGGTYDIYQNFYHNLTSSLPMKDDKFVSHITELLSNDLKSEVDLKQTPEQAAAYFLQKRIQTALQNGDDKPFNSLLSLMNTYGSNDLKHLSEQIKKQIQKTESGSGFPAPTNVKSKVLTPNSVEVTWDQSSGVTGYLISCTSPASYAGNKISLINGGDATTHVLNDLVENTPYDITVQGVTRDGTNSDCSDKMSVKTSTTAPSSPPMDIEIISADPATLKVSWQQPLEINCNGPITGYVIQYARVGSEDNMIVNVPDTKLSISGLFACAKYSVTVAAVNANGTGPFSKPQIGTSGEDTPSIPLSLETVTVTSTAVTLQWKSPEFPNGDIIRYSVHCDGKDIDYFGGDVSDEMIGIIEGLSADTLYVLEMKAHTRVGPGPPVSLPVKTRFPAPTNFKAKVLTPNSVEVTWDQSSGATGYLISCSSPASYAGRKIVKVNGGNTTSYPLTNLVENTPYGITVQGITRDGRKSDHSTEVSITTQKTAPSSPPLDIKVASADPATLNVSWQPPLEINCNGPITGYIIQYAKVESEDNMIVNVPDDTTLSISGLFACAKYSVTVAAVNANGTGPFSKPEVQTSGEDVPSEPQLLEIVTVASTTVTLQWKPPAFPNGVVAQYSIHCDGFDIDDFGDEVSDNMIGTIKGLSADTLYVLEIKAHTRVGPGPPVSLPVKTRLPAPTNVKAKVLTPNSVEVTWDQSSGITGYLISCTSPASYAGNKTSVINGSDPTTHVLNDLLENTPYVITVQGLTRDSRNSDHSTEVSITTQKAAPSSPPWDIKVISVDPASMLVSWKPPLEIHSNGPINGYAIQYAKVGSDDKMIMNVSNETTLKIPGLVACAKYSITIAAVNPNGTGPFSNSLIATSGEDKPSEPLSLEIVTVTSKSVSLQWMPPKTPNGAITHYSIEYDGKCINDFGGDVSGKMTGTIEGLSPDTEYVFKMKAYTRVGAGSPFTLPVTTCEIPTAEQYEIPQSIHTNKAELPTKVCLIPVGKPEILQCDGKYGGSYLWKKHDFKIMMPLNCADSTVNVTVEAYLPSSTQEHPFVSAVFGITATEFKKPITLHLPHCVNYKSEEDKEKLSFLLVHKDSYEFTNEYFEIEESVVSIELSNLSKVYIGVCFASFAPIFLAVSDSQHMIESPGNIKGKQEKIDKSCLDVLILPKSHTETRYWHGTYCIIWDIPTYFQYFEDEKWIRPYQQVLKRKVQFIKYTDDAVAEICLVDETKDGNIELVGNTKILRQKIGCVKDKKDVQCSVDTVTESFPRCFLHIHEKIPSLSRLKVHGICASGEESSEFNLASPTSSNYKFEVHDHYSKDQGIVEISDNYKCRESASDIHQLLGYVERKFLNVLISANQLVTQEELGKGAFGIVHKGILEDSDGTKSTVAIKSIKYFSLNAMKDLVNEAATMKVFDHPNVLKLLAVCVESTDDEILRVVLPYMANGDLQNFLKQKRVDPMNISEYGNGISEKLLLRMCLDTAKGMQYLSSKRFVHRDLAARNCMVDNDYSIKVADFGLTRDIYDTEYFKSDKHVRLPVKWMSPESLLDNLFNEKSDVWSYGITCWEVFSFGITPYPGISNSDIVALLKAGKRLEKPVLCPTKMFTLIEATWLEKASQRPSFKEIVETLSQEPSKPKELIITKVTESEVTLSWKGPILPDSSISEYEVQYRKFGEDHSKTKHSSTCQCEVTGLTPATRYEFRVAPINSAGHGPFTEFVSQSTKRSSRPSLREIIDYNIRNEVAVQWYNLGVQLLSNTDVLDIIRQDHPTNTETCCNEMFNRWLQMDREASWSKLMEALRSIDRNQLADRIDREILKDI